MIDYYLLYRFRHHKDTQDRVRRYCGIALKYNYKYKYSD